MAKKAMTVEAALRWAYREELPKSERRGGLGFASAGALFESYAELLTKIDCNRHGVVPDPAAFGEPHPDALALSAAVQALNGMELAAPDGWNPIADWGDLGALGRAAVAAALDRETSEDATGMRLFKRAPSRLIVKFAILGDRREWEDEAPRVEVVKENGKPKWFRVERMWIDSGRRADQKLGHWIEREVDGLSAKGRRPLPGAYRKYTLEPDPGATIAARMDYEVWRDCLDRVFEAVEPLQSIDLAPSALPARPWEAAGAAPRVLRVEGAKVYAREPPPRARPRAAHPRASEARYPLREKKLTEALDVRQSLDIA